MGEASRVRDLKEGANRKQRSDGKLDGAPPGKAEGSRLPTGAEPRGVREDRARHVAKKVGRAVEVEAIPNVGQVFAEGSVAVAVKGRKEVDKDLNDPRDTHAEAKNGNDGHELNGAVRAVAIGRGVVIRPSWGKWDAANVGGAASLSHGEEGWSAGECGGVGGWPFEEWSRGAETSQNGGVLEGCEDEHGAATLAEGGVGER